MKDRLLNSNCLFIGTSLTDPNLIRYLYGYRGQRGHVAVFVRQADALHLSPTVRQGREDALARRWERCGVEVLFVDHFADVAQLLHEVAVRHAFPSRYVSVDERAIQWLSRVESQVIGIESDATFALGQEFLSNQLRALLRRAIEVSTEFGADFSDEVLAAALWLSNREGTELMSWATTDRLHRDRATLEPVPIVAGSPWVSVEAFCRGARFEEDRSTYASRWRFIRGLPLRVAEGTAGDIPVGCLTLTSNLPGEASELQRMDDGLKTEFHRVLVDGMRESLEA